MKKIILIFLIGFICSCAEQPEEVEVLDRSTYYSEIQLDSIAEIGTCVGDMSVSTPFSCGKTKTLVPIPSPTMCGICAEIYTTRGHDCLKGNTLHIRAPYTSADHTCTPNENKITSGYHTIYTGTSAPMSLDYLIVGDSTGTEYHCHNPGCKNKIVKHYCQAPKLDCSIANFYIMYFNRSHYGFSNLPRIFTSKDSIRCMDSIKKAYLHTLHDDSLMCAKIIQYFKNFKK